MTGPSLRSIISFSSSFKRYRYSKLGALILFSAVCFPRLASSQVTGVAINNLRCEHLVNPLGLDVESPRLSWLDSSPRRGEKQTAYEVLVASTPEMLARNQGDLWDSGKVASSENEAVFDKPLASRQECFWKVRVWGRDGSPSAWSPIALWEMGLLKPEDWTAQWVNADLVSKRPEGGTLEILKATYESADGQQSKDVTDLVKKMVSNNTLTLHVDNGSLGGDPALNKVKQLDVSYTLNGQKKEETIPENLTLSVPDQSSLPYLRKTFTVDKPVARARLYASALGIYELHLNGHRIGKDVFTPGWTDYNKRVQYQEYDVTKLLNSGSNALAGLVGNGWYCGHLGNGGFQQYGTIPALMAQLEITYQDGTTATIITDPSWKTYPSPILSSDMLAGENVDARMEVPGWDKAELDDSRWNAATVRQEHRHLVSQIDQTVRETAELKAKETSEPAPGRWTFDLGQNMVGVARLRISAPAGTQLTLRYAEMLNPDHTVYTANLRGARATDTYICKGGAEETWQPKFTFHGFRYVELTGLPQGQKPAQDAVTGIVLGTDIPRTGFFQCSDPQINQLYSNIWWGQRGNYLSVPTDCPQRDERLGWMGDAEVFVRTATCNADVDAFFTKWLTDVDDAQTPDGAFTDVSPQRGAGSGTPGWADAGVICPWTIYQAYGDKRILQDHLPAMTKWIEWCRVHSTNLIRDKDRGGDYGDWLAPDNTPKDLIGTAFFAYSTHLVAKAYAVVGQSDEAAKYEQLFEQIKTAFNQRYVKPDGHMEGDTQCDYAMALRFELLPEALRPAVEQLLADNVKAKGDHLSTGFLGVGRLLPALSEGGEIGTAYKLLMQDTYPSWLFSVKQGATTIWERWDGWTPERGFQDPGMNSFNHYSLGSCGQWIYSNVAGIAPDPAAPGYAHIIIHPQVGGGLTWVTGSMLTAHGLVTTSWKVADQVFNLDCNVPMNATATIILPAAAASISEGHMPLASARGIAVEPKGGSTGETALLVGSGSYHFSCPLE